MDGDRRLSTCDDARRFHHGETTICDFPCDCGVDLGHFLGLALHACGQNEYVVTQLVGSFGSRVNSLQAGSWVN